MTQAAKTAPHFVCVLFLLYYTPPVCFIFVVLYSIVLALALRL